MRFLLLRRLLSFFIDLGFWSVTFSFWIDLFITSSSINIGINNLLSIISFLIFPFLWYLISGKFLKGFSIGNFIVRIKLISLTSYSYISWKQAFLRIFLYIIDILTLYTFNVLNGKQNKYQSFVETLTNTAFVGYEIKQEDLNDLEKLNSKALLQKMIFFGMVVLTLNWLFIGMIKEDYYLGLKDTKTKFFKVLDDSFKTRQLLDLKKNEATKKCVWNSDEKIFSTPIFVLELYLTNDKERVEVLKNIDRKIESCLRRKYSEFK